MQTIQGLVRRSLRAAKPGRTPEKLTNEGVLVPFALVPLWRSYRLGGDGRSAESVPGCCGKGGRKGHGVTKYANMALHRGGGAHWLGSSGGGAVACDALGSASANHG